MRGLAPEAAHRRRSLRRGVVLGLVLSLHAGLALLLLAPRPPLRQAAVMAPPSASDALQVEFLHRHPPVAVARTSTAPRTHEPHRMPRRLSRALSRLPRQSPVAEVPSASQLPLTRLDLRLPAHAQGDGNKSWHEALGRAETPHRPRLPGMVAGRFVRRIRLRPRTSLKDSLRATGTYLSCSAIKIQEEQGGHSAMLDRAAAEAGCGQN